MLISGDLLVGLLESGLGCRLNICLINRRVYRQVDRMDGWMDWLVVIDKLTIDTRKQLALAT
jgi:hypothetical protein